MNNKPSTSTVVWVIFLLIFSVALLLDAPRHREQKREDRIKTLELVVDIGRSFAGTLTEPTED